MPEFSFPRDLLTAGVWGIAEAPFNNANGAVDQNGVLIGDMAGGWAAGLRFGVGSFPLTERPPLKLIKIYPANTGTFTSVKLLGRIWTNGGGTFPGPGSGRGATFEYGETHSFDSGIA